MNFILFRYKISPLTNAVNKKISRREYKCKVLSVKC